MSLRRGLSRLLLAIALVAVMAMIPSPVFAADGGAAPSAATAVTIAVATGTAGLVAIIRAAVPTMSGQLVPLVVLGVAALFVIVSAFSAGGVRDPLAILLAIVQQAVTAMGIREGVVAMLPGASNLPSRAPATPA